MYTRKQFLRNTLATAVGASLMSFRDFENLTRPAVNYRAFDFHAHPGRFYARGTPGFENDNGILKTVNEMNSSQMAGAFFSLVADTLLLQVGATGITVTRAYKPGEGWAEYNRQLAQIKEVFKANSIFHATQAGDLNGKHAGVAAFLAVEGGDLLEGSVDRLDQVHKDGVRSIQLVHYAPNDLGDLQTENAMFNGLSSFGKNVVRKMNKLGMVIDAAHASYPTTKAIADTTDAPIILSHSVLEMEADRPIAKRAISKEHAKVVAQTGGVIGMWPSGFNKSFDEFVDNTMRMIDVAGVDHVGLGTDMDSNFRPVLSSYTQVATWAEALQAKGLSAEDVLKVTGGNAARVLKKVIKKL